jgi:hypothetical protein
MFLCFLGKPRRCALRRPSRRDCLIRRQWGRAVFARRVCMIYCVSGHGIHLASFSVVGDGLRDSFQILKYLQLRLLVVDMCNLCTIDSEVPVAQRVVSIAS